MILMPSRPIDGTDFPRFQEVSSRYGSKAAGLLLLPPAWCPEFIAVSADLHQAWIKEGKLRATELEQVLDWIDARGLERAIVRSSGCNERIGDRGKFKSTLVNAPLQKDSLSQAIVETFQDAAHVDPDERMGIVVQKYLPETVAGHFSNEIRVSPTRNQWKYDVERPTWIATKGLNSKFAPVPDANLPITCSAGVPHQALRSVGKWMTESVAPRCHIEWHSAEGVLWLLQLDLEWRELDEGFDPTTQKSFAGFVAPKPDKARMLQRYEIGTPTAWRKLQNLSEFDFTASNPGPSIFLLPAADVKRGMSDPSRAKLLVDEIGAVTGDRAVVRTDCKQEGVRIFNLPRTDTVSAREAFDWCCNTLSQFLGEGISIENIAFLVHAFLPSASSAWAYARQDDPTVIVDALWGLPDGLQVLPVDTYEVNVLQKKIIGTKSIHKPRFLRENPDGSWKYEDILRSKGRSHVLKASDILEVATRTRSIAVALRQDAQVMWFCGVPEEFGVGKNVPWFRSREKLDTAPRTEVRYKPYKVRNPMDLERLPDRQAMIQLSPDADLIRDEGFLQKVIDIALEKRLPVQLEGSVLGHTYYRLCQSGVAVVLVNAPKYRRKRERRTFGKIVRDRIPTTIQSGGESVVEALLDKTDVGHGLVGKMVEELEEFLLAIDDEGRTAELADALEVLMGLAQSANVNWRDVIRHADQKRAKRGGFAERRVLLETSLPVPRGSLETVKTVDIRQIGLLEASEHEVKVPITAVVNSIGRPSMKVALPDSDRSFSLRIRDGRLILSFSAAFTESGDNDQLELFGQ